MNLYYFNINKNCNNNCSFCAANYEDLYLHNPNNIFITINQFKEIALQKKMNRGDRVIINGGEPTMNPHLLEILEFCKDSDFETILFTNGRKLSNYDYASRIINSNISKITIPLYGHYAELHNELTRNGKSFDETVAALRNLSELRKDHCFTLEIKVLICKGNYIYIANIVEYILRNFECDILMISGLIPSDVAIKNKQIVEKQLHKKAINECLETLWKHKTNVTITLDGIPLCHLNRKNLMMYAINRKLLSVREEPEKHFYIDVEAMDEQNNMTEIEKWDKQICHHIGCRYRHICRLNTLINHKEYLRDWISWT